MLDIDRALCPWRGQRRWVSLSQNPVRSL